MLPAGTYKSVMSMKSVEVSGGRAELDRWATEQAAQATSNHGLPQFMAVIDSCSTVASDTQRKYGTWATATHW